VAVIHVVRFRYAHSFFLSRILKDYEHLQKAGKLGGREDRTIAGTPGSLEVGKALKEAP
jgi:hypothetical protein